MKKGNNSGNDDFSFSTGGDDEFFPLDAETKSTKDTKAPKGVKGYLKNVAKSVMNLGVKTGKHMYPAAFELGEKFKPDETSTTDTKAIIKGYVTEAKKYTDIGKDIIGSTIKDAKEAVRTGKFVKTEEERNNAEEMFGDMFGDDGFDFGGDEVSYGDDVSGDDASLSIGEDTDDTNTTGATLNTSEAIIKTSYASARINSQLSEKTNAAIVGASQTQIKSDRSMFAQNLEFSQEQHRQKMLLMSNIATNVGKIIEQGNVSIKAQMEFSAKQLAFSQDLAAMVKEVRDAQWKQIKPKSNESAAKNTFQKIFGNGKASGFNLKAFADNFTKNSKSEAAGGAFDMLGSGKEMIDMMLDMGGTATLKNMLLDMGYESFIDNLTSKKSKFGINTLNNKIEGLPGAFNRKLNTISQNGSPAIENIVKKLPFGLGNKLIESGALDVSKIAGWAHVDTDVKVKSGRFDMDPSEVHPFDNAAHKALTEVIPWQLAKIDAGINRTEQEYFDYKNNRWEKVSSAKKKILASRNDALEYSYGYGEIANRIESSLGKDDNGKELGGIDLNSAYKEVQKEFATNKFFTSDKRNKNWDEKSIRSVANMRTEGTEYIVTNEKKILHNIMMLGADYELDDILSSLLDSESDNFPRIFSGLPALPKDVSEDAIGLLLFTVLREFQQTDPEEWVKFQIGLANYKNDLTSANFENEENYFGANAGLVYDASIQSEEFEIARNELAKKRKQLENKRANLEAAKTNGGMKALAYIGGKQATPEQQLKELKAQFDDLAEQEKDLTNIEANATTGIVNIHAPTDADKFIISDLSDSSTHGLINNIYNLLLTGLDVYVKGGSNGKQKEYHDDIINHTLGLNGKESIKEKSFKAAKDKSASQQGSVAYVRLSSPHDSNIKGHMVYKYNPETYTYTKFKDCSKRGENGEYLITVNQTDFDNNELFVKYSDLKRSTAYGFTSVEKAIKEREESFASGDKAFEDTILGKIPGMKAVYKIFNNGSQAISNIGNKFLGENFYSEHEGFQKIDENSDYFKKVLTEDEKKKYLELKEKYEKSPEELKDKAKTELNKFVDSIKETDAAKKAGDIADKTKKSFKFGFNIFSSAYNRSDLSIANKALGTKLSKITVKGKTLAEYITGTKDNELVNKLKNADNVEQQIQIIRDIGTDKAKEYADEAQKMYNSNKAKFDSAFGTKNEDGTTSYTLQSIKVGVADKVRSGLLAVQTKALGMELQNLKDDNGRKLKDVVASIDSRVLDYKLQKATDPIEKCKVLLETQNPELESFKPKIEAFRAEAIAAQNNSGSIKGILGNMKTKLFNIAKNKIGKNIMALNQNRVLSNDLMKIKCKAVGKTVGEVVAEINNPELLTKLKSAKTADEKANILLAYNDPTLNKCKPDIITFKNKIKTRDTSFGGMLAWHKERSKKNMDNFIKNTLIKKLKKLKVGDKTLEDVLNEISKSDPSFKDKIESFTTMTDLAEFLLQSDDPRIRPFKQGIRELKDKHMDDEAQGGVAGIIGMSLVTGFDAIKKGVDKIKSLFDKRKKGSDDDLKAIEKYVHKDIVKMFGGPEATMQMMDSLGIDVEEVFKDDEYHKASKQIEYILERNKEKKVLNGKMKRALKSLMNSESSKESANSSIKSINSNIKTINDSFKKELERSGDSISKEDKKKLEAMRDEDLESENKKLKRAEKKRDNANSKIKKTIGDDDGIEGNSAKEQREAKAKAKEDKEKAKEAKQRFGLLSTLVGTLTSWKKDGFKLDKETTENMKDAVSQGASEGSSEGWTGKISSFMDKTGLSNTKLGKTIQTGLNVGGKATKFLKNSKVVSALGKTGIGSKVLSIGSSLAGGAKAAAAAVKGGATLGGAAATTGGTSGIVKILTKVLKLPKIAAHLGGKAVGTIIKGITDGIKKVLHKIMPKIFTLNGMASNWVGWAALAANAVTSFIKGMSRAKSTFNIGRGLRPTAGMRLACGLAACLDGVLLGIPGIICKAMGYKNAEEWFYKLIGSEAEKAAIERYKLYNKMRSTIFGIDNPDGLVAYENRNLEKGGNFFDNLGAGAKRVGRSVLKGITFGIAKGNDEQDSKLLGFQSVDIFKYWKEKKYTPLSTEVVNSALDQLRKDNPDNEALAGMDNNKLKAYLEQMNSYSTKQLDENEDGEVDDNKKAQEEAAALELQNKYRKIYLELARKYVLDNHIAWLNSHCTMEKFKKYSGQEAKADLSTKDKAKRAASIALNPVGNLLSHIAKKKGAVTEKEAKTIKKTALKTTAVVASSLLLGPMGGIAVAGGMALVSGVKSLIKNRKHIGRAVANLFRKGQSAKLFETPRLMDNQPFMKKYASSKKPRSNFLKKIIEIVDTYGKGHVDEWKDFLDKYDKYTMGDSATNREMYDIFKKYATQEHLDENGNKQDMIQQSLGIKVDQSQLKDGVYENICAASGMVGLITEFYPEVDAMCQSVEGMTLKHIAIRIIVNGVKMAKSQSNYDKYLIKRAEILGAPLDKLKAYEAGLKGGDKASSFGRFKAGFKAFFSKKDSDTLDSQRIGFADVKIYKYWKQHKYDPIIAIEKQVAGKHGKYLEIINRNCEDTEAQNRFITDFLTQATKYVDDNHLAWLTTRTTLDEFNEYEKNGFQSNATLATAREDRVKQLNATMATSKEGSKQYKQAKKELEGLQAAATGTMSSSNKVDLQKDFDAIEQELLKNYKEDGLSAHATASEAIQDVWKSVGGNFYGDEKMPPAGIKPGDITDTRGGPGDEFGAMGSNEKIRILHDSSEDTFKSSASKSIKRTERASTSNTIGQTNTSTAHNIADVDERKKTNDLTSRPTTGKADVKQSNIKQFVTEFKTEMVNKLNVLDEIKAEQSRHNQVSENFYSAMLSMMSIVAKQQGNTQMSSQLDAMVKSITK